MGFSDCVSRLEKCLEGGSEMSCEVGLSCLLFGGVVG